MGSAQADSGTERPAWPLAKRTAAILRARGAPPSPTARVARRIGDLRIALVLLLPAGAGFMVFYVLPSIRGIFLSLTDSTLFRGGAFIGLQNYSRMINDPVVWHAVGVTLLYVLVNIGSQTLIALALAVAMDRLTTSTVVRAVILLPWLIPGVTVGLLWDWLLDPSLGVVGQLLADVGVKAPSFLGSPDLAMPTIALINTWRYAGYVALLLFAGLQLIPRHLYEAAALDGADELQTFRTITLPLLRPVLFLVLLVTIIGSAQVFDLIQVTTKGGPANATTSLYIYIYQQAFENLNIGYGGAIAVAFAIVMVVFTAVAFRFGRGSQSDLSAA
jgi:multiple sugar transport system permease protein